VAIALAALLGSAASLACGDEGAGAVDAVDFAFEPTEAHVPADTEVMWTNGGDTVHTVKGRGFFSRAIEPGDSFRFTFQTPGTYRYFCTLHPDSMRGMIVVER
jgi:plastocyanin